MSEGAGNRSLFGAGLLLVLGTALVSGLSNFVNIYAVAGTNSAAFVTVRNAFVAVLLLPWLAATALPRSRRVALGRSDWALLVTIGLVGGAVPFLLFFQGLEMAGTHGSTTASFLYRTLFLFATVFSILYLKERFHWRAVLGAALLLGGSYLLLSITSPVWTDGSLYVLAATVMWAGEYTLSKRLLGHLPSSTVALGRMGFGAVFLLAYLGATFQGPAVAAMTGAQWTWVAISGLLLCAFVFLWYSGLSKVDLGVGSSVLVLGYPFTWLLMVSLHGEVLSVDQAAGAVVVLFGVLSVIGLARLRAFGDWLRDGIRVRAGEAS